MSPQWVNAKGASHVAHEYAYTGWSTARRALCGRVVDDYEYVSDSSAARKPCSTCLTSLMRLMKQGGFIEIDRSDRRAS